MSDTVHDTIDFAVGRLTFEQWLDAVDKAVIGFTGSSREDFRDWHYADSYADGVEPRDAAILMLSKDSIGREFLALAGIDPEEF